MKEIYEKILSTIQNVEEREQMNVYLEKKRALSEIQGFLNTYDYDNCIDNMLLFTYVDILSRYRSELIKLKNSGNLQEKSHDDLLILFRNKIEECLAEWDRNIKIN